MKAVVIVPRIGAGTKADPYRPDLTIATRHDITGQPVADIAYARAAYTVEIDATTVQLNAIKADSRYVVVSEGDTPANLTQAELDALKVKLATIYNQDVVDWATKDSSNPNTIAGQMVAAQVRPPWRVGQAVTVGQVYAYQGNLYEAIQAHTTQADWTPVVAKALYKRFYEPDGRIWAWVQPTGAHDAYPVGAKVTYGGYTWQSTIPANVWQPGVTGWTNLTPPPQTAEWAVGVAYKVNDQVTYQGSTYRCLQAHTSIASWTPTAAVSLWQKV